MRIAVRVNSILNALRDSGDLGKVVSMVGVLALKMLPESSVSSENYHNGKKLYLGIGRV
jgi:hypothetical protein